MTTTTNEQNKETRNKTKQGNKVAKYSGEEKEKKEGDKKGNKEERRK